MDTQNQKTQSTIVIGEYTYIKLLGKGVSSTVGLFQKKGEMYAIKLINTKYISLFKQEVALYKKVNHPHIVKYIESFENKEIIDSKNQLKYVNCIVFEYVKGGELFDFVESKNTHPELARKFFIQILKALNYLHSMQICHRDIKLENILIDEYENVKVCDLGFADYTSTQQNGYFKSFGGTLGYLAPEVKMKIPYNGVFADIFSLGVVLFMLYTHKPPFKVADSEDPWFKQIINHNYQKFWELHKMSGVSSECQKQFKSLFILICQYEPATRISLADICAHPWTDFKQHMSNIKLQQDKKNQQINEIDNELKTLLAPKTSTPGLILPSKKIKQQEDKLHRGFDPFLEKQHYSEEDEDCIQLIRETKKKPYFQY